MQRIEQIHMVAKTAGKVSGIVLLGVIVFFLVFRILVTELSCLSDYDLMPWVYVLLKYLFWGSLGFFFFFAIIQYIFEQFGVKSDDEIEEEERILQVIDMYDNRKKGNSATVDLPENYNPLRKLDDKQQEVVLKIIANLPANPKKTDEIKLDILAHYLTALYQLKYLDITDKSNLRLWTAKITGKNMPDTSHFNAAIPKKDSKKIDEAKEIIIRALGL
ncbi:MAG: hypothetical protein II827_01280 [Paludibacteraceae bacterium]|nr:hypothetical protein [Paludibacteraceae bacterium]